MPRECDECSLCCKVFNINKPDELLVKPADKWCMHCVPDKGCGIYASRPPTCVEFSCLWRSWDTLSDGLRPDRVKAVFQDTAGPAKITLTLDNRDALHNQDLQDVIKAVVEVQQFLIVMFKSQLHSVYFRHKRFGKYIITHASGAQYANLVKNGGLPGLPEVKP